MTDDGRYEAGLRVRREVLGDEHVARSLADSGLDADFQRFLTEVAWGGVWTRDDHLDRRSARASRSPCSPRSGRRRSWRSTSAAPGATGCRTRRSRR